jgi:muramoyltetrapeptide carboxypeptidase
MDPRKIIKIIKSKNELSKIPVLANVDFGHTTPQITFPIGGRIRFSSRKQKSFLNIIKH